MMSIAIIRRMSVGAGDGISAFVAGAINRGFDELQRTGALPPFLVYRVGGAYKLERLTATNSAEASAAGRERARKLDGADACVLVYDGFLRSETGRSDAVLAEGHERVAEHGYMFGRRYEAASSVPRVRPLDSSTVALGTCTAILPASPPYVETHVLTPGGALIDTLITVKDRLATEYLILHQGEVVRLQVPLPAGHKMAAVVRVEAADEWTPALTERLVSQMLTIHRDLDPADVGKATCIVGLTADHVGEPSGAQALKPLIEALRRVSSRAGGTGVRLLSKASKGPGSFEEAAHSIIRGLKR